MIVRLSELRKTVLNPKYFAFTCDCVFVDGCFSQFCSKLSFANIDIFFSFLSPLFMSEQVHTYIHTYIYTSRYICDVVCRVQSGPGMPDILR